MATTSLTKNEPLVIFRSTKKLEAKVLERLVRSGKEETFGGQKVLSGSNLTAFIAEM